LSDTSRFTFDDCDPDLGCVHTLIDCDDNNVCTIDDCDPNIGCVFIPIICPDGNNCTQDNLVVIQFGIIIPTDVNGDLRQYANISTNSWAF